jgi:lipopolysaccharide biosynthesis protein
MHEDKKTDDLQVVAIYLPQYHPIPENDEWWGKGFTEWFNVVKSKPRFRAHYQPHLPADLGFYDLRLDEVRQAQEQLAVRNGINAFCYYHYWFNGKRLLEKPIEMKLKNSDLTLPFMLCWANENWTRAWDGGESQILIKQEYSLEDDRHHFQELARYFSDSRYMKVDGKPVFLIYRPKLFPNIRETIEIWREEAMAYGFPGIHIGYVQSWGVFDPPQDMGFDFAIEFHPFSKKKTDIVSKKSFISRLSTLFNARMVRQNGDMLMDYWTYVESQMVKNYKSNVSPGITPMWDNSARRAKNALIWVNSTPEVYKKWLDFILKEYPWGASKEKMLFINAWNEWAEGNHLEPCTKWGSSYLEATKSSLNTFHNQETEK